MLEQGPELLIKGVTRQDIGLYYCVAVLMCGCSCLVRSGQKIPQIDNK